MPPATTVVGVSARMDTGPGKIPMQKVWTVVDTGLRPADENIAIDQAILRTTGEGLTGPVFRFLHFQECALLGYHQSAAQELDLDFCREQGIEVQRRMTGGGAIIFDPTHLGWEIVCPRDLLPAGDMTRLSEEICEAAVLGLSALGVRAQFRPRNDIEVEGRKLSGTGGILDGKALLFQGTVLVELDIPRMLRVLRVPAEKLDAHAIASVAERVTSLRTLLGKTPAVEEVQSALLSGFREHFGWRMDWSASLPDAVWDRFPEALKTIRSAEWLGVQDRPREELPFRQAVLRTPGGTLRANILWDTFGKRIKQLHFSGDYFIQPRRAVVDLEAALRNAHIQDVDGVVQAWFERGQIDAFGLEPCHFVQVLRQAVA